MRFASLVLLFFAYSAWAEHGEVRFYNEARESGVITPFSSEPVAYTFDGRDVIPDASDLQDGDCVGFRVDYDEAGEPIAVDIRRQACDN
jgi:cold shock CspA family protein